MPARGACPGGAPGEAARAQRVRRRVASFAFLAAASLVTILVGARLALTSAAGIFRALGPAAASCTGRELRAWGVRPGTPATSAGLGVRTPAGLRSAIGGGHGSFREAVAAAPSRVRLRVALEAEEFRTLQEGAESGDLESQFLLGRMYLEGDGMERNASEAAEWFTKAADAGLAGAQYNLGMMYLMGDGVEENGRKGAYWLEKAAIGEVPLAQYFFGQMLLQGELVESDMVRATDLLKAAAESGIADAQYVLGTILLNTPPDSTEEKQWAAHWLNKAAEQDDPRAKFQIGRMFLFGVGMEKDPAKAANWVSSAASQGYRDAQYMMGSMLLEGIGVEKNQEWAAYWFQEAADQGQVDAMYNLALMFESGDGVEQDQEEARKWFRMAAMEGDEQAAEVTQEIFSGKRVAGNAAEPTGQQASEPQASG
mmetsp:Transcript_71113/g.197530  ORF Transcript_71113/g.197530 Transcript_71113/m.197530 type:complete len:426 (-) Transcript_71113:198-1475(-)